MQQTAAVAEGGTENTVQGVVSATISIDVRIESLKALRQAAAKEYVLANARRPLREVIDEFDEMCGPADQPNVPLMIRLLFDSGRYMEDVSVEDNSAIIHAAPRAANVEENR